MSGKRFSFLLFPCFLIFLSVAGSRAGTTNLFNLAQTGGSSLATNNGNSFLVSGTYFPKQTFLFQSLGITNASSGSYLTNGITNVLQINIQFSVDSGNSNWVTLATYNPSTTNAAVENFNPTFSNVSIPMRAQIVTSNSTGVATFVTQ